MFNVYVFAPGASCAVVSYLRPELRRHLGGFPERQNVAIGKQAVFRGSITALVTPFQDGHFDEARFRALVDWQIVSGTHGLVPAGTTGESPTLSHEEHRAVIAACVSEARGGCRSSPGRARTIRRKRSNWRVSRKRPAPMACSSSRPITTSPRKRGFIRHFKAVNDAVGIPIIIYNIPPRSVVDMSIDTMKRLVRIEEYRGRQGCDRQSRPHRPAAPGAWPGLHPALRRGYDGARGDGAWRPWLHFGHLECRAATLRRRCRRRVLAAISRRP